MNACEIKPPVYEKKVGRPSNKSRRKQPYEIEKKDGTKVLTRHGGTITCSYCHGHGHNIKGCNQRKAGILPKKQVRRGLRAIPDDVSDDDQQAAGQVPHAAEQEGQLPQQEVNLTQDGGQLTQDEVNLAEDDAQVPQHEVNVTQDDGQLTQEEVHTAQNAAQEDEEYDTPVVFQVNANLLSTLYQLYFR